MNWPPGFDGKFGSETMAVDIAAGEQASASAKEQGVGTDTAATASMDDPETLSDQVGLEETDSEIPSNYATAEETLPTTTTSTAASSLNASAMGPPPAPPINARTSFTADSPYFHAFCESDVKSLCLLSDTLRDICDRTKTVCKAGAIYGEATHRLAQSCRSTVSLEDLTGGEETELSDSEEGASETRRQRRQAVGEEMSLLLQLLGDMLEEVADTQFQLCQALENTLAVSLEAFAETELKTVSMLKQEAEETTEAAEQIYARYLNSKQVPSPVAGLSTESSGGSNNSSSNNNNNSSDNSNLNVDFSAKSGKSSGLFKNVLGVRKNLAAEIDRRRAQRQESSHGSEADATLARAMEAAQMRSGLEHIKLAQATAELKRFQLMKHLISIKHRRNFELGENATSAVYVIRDFHRRCAGLVQQVIPKIQSIQERQVQLREHHASVIVPTWRDREGSLTGVVDKTRKEALQAIQTADAIAEGDPKLIDQQQLKTEEIEEAVNLWSLPNELALSARYQRECMPGVLLEGWLYRKSSALISLQPWSRRWFVMDHDRIYYYRNENDSRRTSNNAAAYAEQVKVCDVVLCTVRELNQPDHQPRFCFQLVTPHEKPLTLQARGPVDYRTWVDGIRANIENRLVYGDPHSDELNKNIGKKRRGSLLGDDAGQVKSFSEKPPTEFFEPSESSDLWESFSALPAERAFKNPIVVDIMAANPRCADCDTADPDWASLNLGVMLCIECSAVHRSLGVHVSKVRSLTLDSLSQAEARLLLALGNDRANAIWEEGLALQKGWKKPTPAADRKTREEWIKSKYAWKGFLGYNNEDGTTEEQRRDKFSHELYEAAKACDLPVAAHAVAHGGSVEWSNPEEGGKTALHVCALARRNGEWPAIEMAEFLIQNGAKLDAFDSAAHGVLDCALLGNAELEMVEYLTSKRY